VWDCQYAGRFIQAAHAEAAEIDSQLQAAGAANPTVAELHPPVYSKRQIHFAACGANQVLPRIPGMPDDIFSACLMCPLRIALLYHNLQTFPLAARGGEHYLQRSSAYMSALWENMSQGLKNRLWSELQAILHTIAWQTIPSKDYQMLLGQKGDAISNMAGGFLLSQRVLATYRTYPESIPHIPSSTSHSLWIHWDLILDNLFAQLPDYFDSNGGDSSWEAGLLLVSFMEDQLGSILTSNQGAKPDLLLQGNDAALSRLPIICQAALTPKFRLQACNALDACLQNLDLRGLEHAVNCGTLDVATQLLLLEDPALSTQLISIWASLVRHSSSIRRIAGASKGTEQLPQATYIKLFLSSLEQNLKKRTEDNGTIIIQAAAILATIISFLGQETAPGFLHDMLQLAYLMLQDPNSLVQQWGAILSAELLPALGSSQEEKRDVLRNLEKQLFVLVDSSVVENRASAIYALSRWTPTVPTNKLENLGPSLNIAKQLLHLADDDASILVRKEVIHLLSQLLHAAGKWSILSTWIYLMEAAIVSLPSEAETILGVIKDSSRTLKLSPEQRKMILTLHSIILTLVKLQQNPDCLISSLASKPMEGIAKKLQGDIQNARWSSVLHAGFHIKDEDAPWDIDGLQVIQQAGDIILKNMLDAADNNDLDKTPSKPNSDLFVRTKLALQAYISVSLGHS
jgi:hypothetical protein